MRDSYGRFYGPVLTSNFSGTLEFFWNSVMKNLLPFAAALTCALWLGAIAILAIQNFSLVSLTFFSLPLLKIPVGILLAFCIMLGMLGIILFEGGLRRR